MSVRYWQGSEEASELPGTGPTEDIALLCWFWEPNPSPLQEQPVLLTTGPSPWPLSIHNFVMCWLFVILTLWVMKIVSCWHISLCHVKNNSCVHLPSQQKVLFGKPSTQSQIQVFPKSRKLAFYHWQQIDPVVFLMAGTPCAVFRKCVPSHHLGTAVDFGYQFLCQLKEALSEKARRPLHNLVTGSLCSFIKKRVEIHWQFNKCVCFLSGFLTGSVWHWGAR